MARFFFNFDDGETRQVDDCGLELKDAEQAYLEAIAAARAMWPELLGARRDPLACAFEIADEKRRLLFRVAFGEVLETCRLPIRGAAAAPKPADLTHSLLRAGNAAADLRQGFKEARRHLEEAAGLIKRLNELAPTRPGSSV